MNDNKYKDYSWIWLVVGLVVPNIEGLVFFFISGDIVYLGAGVACSTLICIILVYFFYVRCKHPNIKSRVMK